MRTLDALKKLAVKCTSATSVADVTGDTVDEVIAYMEANFNIVGVTAIALTTTDGAVTGGTCTFSDSTTAAITVTGT